MNDLDPVALRRETDRLLECVTSPEFLAQIEEVRRLPRDQRIGAAAKRLTPVAMRERGIDLPEGARLSSRYFEEGDDVRIELGSPTGRVALVPAIEELQPGLLDRIRSERPDLFKELVSQPVFAGTRARPTVCLCVGGFVCGGIGG